MGTFTLQWPPVNHSYTFCCSLYIGDFSRTTQHTVCFHEIVTGCNFMLTDEWVKTWMPFSITRRLYFGEYLFILCNVMIFASDSAVLRWRWLFPMWPKLCCYRCLKSHCRGLVSGAPHFEPVQIYIHEIFRLLHIAHTQAETKWLNPGLLWLNVFS